jgi:hypothetical protein
LSPLRIDTPKMKQTSAIRKKRKKNFITYRDVMKKSMAKTKKAKADFA